MQEKQREYSIFKERILQYLDLKGISKYECYNKTGISRSVLSQSNGMTEENLLKFLAQFDDISPDWLLYGKGEMLRNEQKIGDISNSTVVGANVSGNGNTIQHHTPTDAITDIFKKQQEQTDILIAILEKLGNK